VKLTDEVYLVGGGPFTGFGLTSGTDSHAYLIDGGSELALLDCGMGAAGSLQDVMRNVEADSCDTELIKQLLLTHYHVDHAGGARSFRDALALEVVASSETADALEAGDEDAVGLSSAKQAGMFPADYVLEPCPVSSRLTDGDVVSVGNLRLQFLGTPGHSNGHGSFLLTGGDRTLLFAGDSVFWSGQILMQATADCDLPAMVASIRRLHGLEFDAFLPGHGAITLKGGHMHVDMAVAAVDRLGVPRNIV
jgi:glyoxylase-like metal-dependent hydrolase (beta-lactamase superfamily II)